MARRIAAWTSLRNCDDVVGLHILDQAEAYTIDHKYQGQLDRHANIVFQYTHTPCDANTKCLGAANKDQFDLLITGLDKVDFGNKDMEECLSTKLRSGSVGTRGEPTLAEGDVTPCVSWVNKYWGR